MIHPCSRMSSTLLMQPGHAGRSMWRRNWLQSQQLIQARSFSTNPTMFAVAPIINQSFTIAAACPFIPILAHTSIRRSFTSQTRSTPNSTNESSSTATKSPSDSRSKPKPPTGASKKSLLAGVAPPESFAAAVSIATSNTTEKSSTKKKKRGRRHHLALKKQKQLKGAATTDNADNDTAKTATNLAKHSHQPLKPSSSTKTSSSESKASPQSSKSSNYQQQSSSPSEDTITENSADNGTVIVESSDLPTKGVGTLRVSKLDAKMPFNRWIRKQLPHAILSDGKLFYLCHSRQLRLVTKHKGKYRSLTIRKMSLPMKAGDEVTMPLYLLAAKESSNEAYRPRCALTLQEINSFVSCVVAPETADVLVLNKPNGLPTHRTIAWEKIFVEGNLWTLEDRIQPLPIGPELKTNKTNPTTTHPKQKSEKSKPQLQQTNQQYYVLNRLDTEASGCVIIAKTARAAELLTKHLTPSIAEEDASERKEVELQRKWIDGEEDPPTSPPSNAAKRPLPTYSPDIWQLKVLKEFTKPKVQIYHAAIVHGKPKQKEGILVSHSPTGEIYSTSYRVEQTFSPHFADARVHGHLTLIELVTHHGRLHQLRRHCHEQLGCTIVGERLHELDDALSHQPRSSAEQQQLLLKERQVHHILQWNDLLQPFPLFLHAYMCIIYHPELNGGQPLKWQFYFPQPFRDLTALIKKVPSPANLDGQRKQRKVKQPTDHQSEKTVFVDLQEPEDTFVPPEDEIDDRDDDYEEEAMTAAAEKV